MIHIRVNRQDRGFIELHSDSEGESADFPGCQYVTIKDLDGLITILQEVQHFMLNIPEPDYRTWGIMNDS